MNLFIYLFISNVNVLNVTILWINILLSLKFYIFDLIKTLKLDNIQQDFTGGAKNPKYLMVTGMANIPRGRSNTQVGNSLIYIAEASSGEVAAYALPWNSSLNAKGQAQRGGFMPLAKGSFRTTFVRDE